MTNREEIERLLNMTGRTLEGLPDTYPLDVRVHGILDIAKYEGLSPGAYKLIDRILHQSDVIELLVAALRDALEEAEKQKTLAELNRILLDEANKMLEEADKHIPKWISVKECLSDTQRNILTVNGHGVVRIMALMGYAAEKWKWIDNGRFKYYNDITHWMPLPEPPEEE